MTLSLDTAAVIDLIRGRSGSVRDRYREAAHAGRKMVVSAMVMHELVSGIVTSRNPGIERQRMQETLVGLPVIELAPEDTEVTGSVAGELRRLGRSIGDIDTLIAGQALARGWTVVTGNVSHFGRVEGLSLIDWGVSSDILSTAEVARRVAVAR